MRNFFSPRQYQHLNTIRIDATALRANHEALQAFHPEAQICPVLKSNAYGHGIATVAPIFDSLGCPFLVVDSLYEAYELYKLKVQTPILIMGYTAPENLTVKRLPFHFAVFDLETAAVLNRYQPGCSIHVFVDTGMNREGVTLNDLPAFLEKLRENTQFHVVGLCSHFADADNPDSKDFVDTQLKAFKKALALMYKYRYIPKWRHISGSGGTLKVHDKSFTMIRAGIAHYGIHPLVPTDPSHDELSLCPILEFHSTMAQVKHIKKGSFVGYNCTFEAKKDMVIGFLPAGYYEGIDRRLSNNGWVKIGNTFCPIIGRVSMNMTTIDLTDVENPQVGQDVCIYSANPIDRNSLKNSAIIAKTIPYELLVHLAESVYRKTS